MAALTVVPSTSGILGNYSVSKSPDGGWNYSFNGNPITREAYAAAGGTVRADPVKAAATPAPTNPNGSSGTTYADKSNDIAANNAYLGAEDQKTATGNAAIDANLTKVQGEYDADSVANEGKYKANSDLNTNNLQVNKQTALVNAAQGRQGLYGTLASIGALNGSGIDKANAAVASGANADLAGASNNYATNASALDDAIGSFRTDNERKKQDAIDAAANAKLGLANDVAKERAGLFQNLVSDYAAEGNARQAKAYTDKITALAPELARTSVPTTGPVYSAAAYTPTTLANYIAGANSTQVSTNSTNGVGQPGLTAAPIKKKTA